METVGGRSDHGNCNGGKIMVKVGCVTVDRVCHHLDVVLHTRYRVRQCTHSLLCALFLLLQSDAM